MKSIDILASHGGFAAPKPVLGTRAEKGKPQKAAIIGLVVGISISLAVFVGSAQYLLTQHYNSLFNQSASPFASSLVRTIDRYVGIIHAIDGLYAASENVERDEFRAFVRHSLAEHSGIQALEWIPRVPATKRAAYEAQARAEGLKGFQFTERDAEGKVRGAGARDDYYPVYFAEPRAGNEAALGFDLGSNPARRDALLRARDTGHPVVTPRIKLVQETGDQYGFLIFMPIYATGSVPETLKERRAQNTGFALGVFRIGDMLETIMTHSSSPREFDLYLFDDDAKPKESLLYFRPSPLRAEPIGPVPQAEFQGGHIFASAFEIGDRRWRIVFVPAPEAWKSHLSVLPLMLGGGGLIFTALLVLYLQLSGTRTGEISRLVMDRTADLDKTNKALQDEMEERRRVQQNFTQAQKMDAIGQLTGGIAHDFNNLLMVIDGYARRTLANMNDLEVAGRSLEEVLSATEKAARLTKQLLVFSRRQVMERRVFRVAETIAELKGLLAHSVGEWYEVKFEFEDRKVCVDTDPAELGQAVLNLAINARDAMPKGGLISIGLGAVELGEAFTNGHADMSPGKYAAISVTDQGSGIGDDVLEHIFEPFFTTKDQGQGTGLGLAMVYGFAEQSGGTIDVSTEVGKGTTFRIYLPVVDRPPEVAAAEEETEYRGKGERILLVEDDDRLLELTHDVLRDLGYHVLTAGTGLEALEVDEQLDKPIDLLVSDVVMPSLGGFELYEILREKRSDLRAVFMSGYPKRGAGKVEIPENVPFLQKPVATRQLAQAIRKELDAAASLVLAPTNIV